MRVPFDDDDDGGLVVNRFLAQQRELHKSLSEISSTEVLREAEELRVEENDEDDIDKLIEELGVGKLAVSWIHFTQKTCRYQMAPKSLLE